MSAVQEQVEDSAMVDEGPGLPISDVSRLLGVPVPTLRSWELRYGIPDNPRVAGTHRRYQAEQLHALRLMRDEIARGQRAGAAAKSVRSMLGLTGPARVYIDNFLAASQSGDTAEVRLVLERSRRELGLGGAIDDVLLPAMRQIGLWWQAGRCDLPQDHMTTEAARGWLNAVASFAPAPVHAEPVLLACGPVDLHTLGLEAMATLLRYRRWNCRVLGARVPAPALLTAARATGATGVVVVAHLVSGRRRALESIRLIDDAGLPVFYAGNAFGTPRARSGFGGTYLGTRLETAAQVVDEQLAAREDRLLTG